MHTAAVSNETLSQNEIDNLLRRGAAAMPDRRAASIVHQDVQVYDFRRPNRVSKERLRTLESMYERLVKSLESWLIGRVRGQIELRLQSIEPFSFGEFTLSLPTPCASYLFSVRDSGGMQGVIDVGYEFAYFIVDRLFGGSGHTMLMNRGLSSIERQAVRGIAERITSLLEDVWADHVPLDIELTGFETFPEILQAVNREDPVLVANIEVIMPGGASSLLLICLPFAVLDKFFGGALQKRSSAPGSDREREESRTKTEYSVRNVRVAIAARLPEIRLPLSTIAEMQVGSVIDTGLDRSARANVLVSGQRRFTGPLGRVGPRLAVHVQETVRPNDEPESAPPTDPASLTPIF